MFALRARAFVLLLAAFPAQSELVRDINPGERPTMTGPLGDDFVASRGTGYFVAHTREAGGELWKTDGTPQGTELVADLSPGPDSSAPSFLHAFRGGVLLMGTRPPEGRQLWFSDGNARGTVALATLSVPDGGGGLVVAGPRGFFTADVEEVPDALWMTDGTPDGTSQVPSETLGSVGVFGVGLANGRVLLGVGTRDRFELWASDGSREGTRPLGVELPVPYGNPVEIRSARVGRRAIVRGFVGPGTTGLFATDGTPAGTTLLVEGGVAEDLASSGQLAYFERREGSDVQTWKTDGTVAGTVPFDAPGAASGLASNRAGSLLYQDPDGTVWVTDGTAAGTRRILAEPVFVRAATGRGRGFVFSTGLVLNHGFRFEPIALWSSDGTEAGTRIILDGPVPSMGTLRNRVVLQRTEYEDDGYYAFETTGQPWITDGTSAGTRLLGIESNSVDSNPRGFTQLGDELYFAATTEEEGRELWKTDGTEAGTVLVHDLNDLEEYSGPSIVGVVGAKLIFSLPYAPIPRVFITDGTPAGLEPLPELSSAGGGRLLGDRLVFLARTALEGLELWSSDGTPEGTHLVLDAIPGPESSGFTATTKQGDELFYLHYPNRTFRSRAQVWRSDGSASGTLQIGTLPAEPEATFSRSNGLYSQPAVLGEALYLGAEPEGELYRFDFATRALEPVRLSDPKPLETDLLTRLGDLLVFFADDGTSGSEPWATDGTSEGTRPLRDIHPGPVSSIARTPFRRAERLAAGESVFLPASDGEHGFELWASDGTPEGTRLVVDLWPGLASSDPRGLREAGGRVVFIATSEHGDGIYISDGTPDGTRQISDVGAYDSVFSAGLLGERIYFNGIRNDVGSELFGALADPDPPRRCDRREWHRHRKWPCRERIRERSPWDAWKAPQTQP